MLQKIFTHILMFILQKHTNKLGTNLQIGSPNFFSMSIFTTVVRLFIFFLVIIPISTVSYRNKTRESEDQTLHFECAN